MLAKQAKISLVILVASTLAPNVGLADPPTATVVANVSTFKNQKGFLGCRLFSTSNGFPDGVGRDLRKAIVGTSVSCTFDAVAPGTYAIAVIHDENSNGKLDKNFFGVPSEGYGVSNNHTYGMSSPKWDESKFTIVAGETKTLTISLRY
jgi:uncharacterized protein (DUF2141 family)